MNSNPPRAGSFPAVRQRLAAWVPVLALAAAVAVLALGGDAARELLRYERDGIEAGQLWRLLTGHLVHLGWPHVLMNLAALIVLRLLVGAELDAADWAGAALASAAAVDLGLYFAAEQVQWYVGLSGVLHGLLAAGALALLRVHAEVGGVLAAGLVAKLIFEQSGGSMPLTETAAGGPVIVAAHLYGAAGGAVYALIRRTVRRRGPPPL